MKRKVEIGVCALLTLTGPFGRRLLWKTLGGGAEGGKTIDI